MIFGPCHFPVDISPKNTFGIYVEGFLLIGSSRGDSFQCGVGYEFCIYCYSSGFLFILYSILEPQTLIRYEGPYVLCPMLGFRVRDLSCQSVFSP